MSGNSPRAAAAAKAGKQVVDLTWRKDYNADKKINWEKEFSPTRDNTRRTQSTTRHWGMDQWASPHRAGSLDQLGGRELDVAGDRSGSEP